MGKQSQLLLKPTEVELGLQVGVEFDNTTQADTLQCMHTSYQTWPYQHIAFTSFLGAKAPLELANLVSVTKKFQNCRFTLEYPNYMSYLRYIMSNMSRGIYLEQAFQDVAVEVEP